jgi:probable F420-dependent oxidoreductase
MRFSYAEAMIDPAFWLPLAQAAEDAGYHSITVADSVAYPKESDSTYPYNPDGTREFLDDKPFIDPFVLMAAMGAVTSRLRFTTFVIKLPIRSPVLVAKQAASVAVMTGGRLVLGVGTSPWLEDYVLTGTPWERRGKRMDEAIDIVKGLCTPARLRHDAGPARLRHDPDGYFEYHGEVYDLPAAKITPVPESPIPILIGGHHDAALRRAARVGDGWMHGGGDPANLPGLLDKLHAFRVEAGRDDAPFEIHAISTDAYSRDGIKHLEELGVTDVIVGFRWPYGNEQDTEPLQTKIDNLRRYADTVIAAV